ncbi:uncharacterized protein LOC123680122 isoform X1 [Harmonia axyridis]|uniref:uncharacterized protein LOC123680122 isoform X1 n=1 Tax=Harmonia axyridis TaxID=115357 RepID=UPI001E277012|nr:uncharacterized protein LOC123680122 isoform X1 [Harmonia axyridis]
MMNKRYRLHVAQLNVRSLLCHFSEFKETLYERKFDICCVTETWLKDEPDYLVNIDQYDFVRNDRLTRGGGTGIYVNKNIKYREISFKLNLENTTIFLEYDQFKILICAIYRPPSVDKKFLIEDIEDSLLASIPYSENLVIVGDKNIDVSNTKGADCVFYLSALNTFGLAQLVDLPTRKDAILDHVITNTPEALKDVKAVNYHYSDHDITSFTVDVDVSHANFKYVTYRDFRNFSPSSFSDELAYSSLDEIFVLRNIDDKVAHISCVLTRLFDKHAPVRSCRITKPPAPWLTNEIRQLMNNRDRAKKKYRKSRTALNR